MQMAKEGTARHVFQSRAALEALLALRAVTAHTRNLAHTR